MQNGTHGTFGHGTQLATCQCDADLKPNYSLLYIYIYIYIYFELRRSQGQNLAFRAQDFPGDLCAYVVNVRVYNFLKLNFKGFTTVQISRYCRTPIGISDILHATWVRQNLPQNESLKSLYKIPRVIPNDNF